MKFRWLAVLLFLAVPTEGAEKWYLVPASEAIITGRLEHMWRIPWFDGWHLWSKVRVDLVLNGNVTAGAVLEHSFLCPGCGTADMWHLHPDWWAPSIWYLKRVPGGGWTSPGQSDFGQRPITDLPALLPVLRQ
jgi:hypothetical protein